MSDYEKGYVAAQEFDFSKTKYYNAKELGQKELTAWQRGWNDGRQDKLTSYDAFKRMNWSQA
jgi:hypothetical protein